MGFDKFITSWLCWYGFVAKIFPLADVFLHPGRSITIHYHGETVNMPCDGAVNLLMSATPCTDGDFFLACTGALSWRVQLLLLALSISCLPGSMQQLDRMSRAWYSFPDIFISVLRTSFGVIKSRIGLLVFFSRTSQWAMMEAISKAQGKFTAIVDEMQSPMWSSGKGADWMYNSDWLGVSGMCMFLNTLCDLIVGVYSFFYACWQLNNVHGRDTKH